MEVGSSTAAHAPPIDRIGVEAYRIPTDGPEEDGSFAWDATVLVVVEAGAAGFTGMGFTYADKATAVLIRDTLSKAVNGLNPLSVGSAWSAMDRSVRNLGQSGIASMAISAVDTALWDLKARILGLSLVHLLGKYRKAATVYGSGGFTNYGQGRLEAQLHGWLEHGIRDVKIKVGARPEEDLERVRFARNAVGPDTRLYVDANGAYSRKQAETMAGLFGEAGVTWFEEPVPSWDVDGTRAVCGRLPEGMELVGGEYGYRLPYFLRLLRAQAVDCLQADVTRCGGITGFLMVSALCEAFNIPLSTHCAPSLHLPLGCAVKTVRNLEYFHDHALIESRFFDGHAVPVRGEMRPDLSRPGLGLEFKKQDAESFSI